MKLYKITITPSSNFATTLKGDTLFGQLCWAVFYTLGQEKLSKLLEDYSTKPFLVVSDAFPQGYLPKPKIPNRFLKEDPNTKKENRKKLWMCRGELKNGEYNKARKNEEINNRDKKEAIIHNALNYQTFHTGEEHFAPYGVEEFSLSVRDIYFLIDEREEFNLEVLKEVFTLVSNMGYGKDSSIGKGRFDIEAWNEIHIDHNAKTFMSLSPFSPQGLESQKIYYEPFTRFGKFGGSRAYKNAFKKPLLLADSASVIHFQTSQRHQYLGEALEGLTDIPEYKDTVHQGYSIVIPIKDLDE